MTVTSTEPPRAQAVHSSDFSVVVVWRGKKFFFTRMQSLVVKALFEAMAKGYDAERQDRLLQAADSDQSRLKDLFNRGKHPAWNALIVPVQELPGAYKLAFAGNND